MSKKKGMIILLALLAILLIVYRIVINIDIKTDDTELDEGIKIAELSDNEISEFAISNSKGTLNFINNSGTFTIKGTENINVDTSLITDYIYYIKVISAQSIVSENSESAEEFGFNTPSSTVTINTHDGLSHVYLLGNKTPTLDGYYFKEKNSNKVYVINAVRGEKYLVGLSDFRSNKVINMTEDDIYSFEFSNGSNVVSASKEKTSTSLSWRFTKPYEKTADASKISSDIISYFLQIKIDGFEADNVADLSKYGINANSKTLTLHDNIGNSIKLTFGNKSGDYTYFTVNSEKNIYLVNSESLKFFDINPLNFTDRLLFLPNLSDLSSVKINHLSKTYEINFSTNNDEIVSTVNGRNLTSKETKDLFIDMFSFLVSGILDNKNAVDTELSILVNYKNNTSDKLEFKKINDREYGAFINGKGNFFVDKNQISTLLDKLLAY